MTDSAARRLEALSALLEALETAAEGLDREPGANESVRRIARALAASAGRVDLREIAAGAQAIQRAADAHLARSVANFLARIEELRAEGPPEEATILLVEDDRTSAAATRAYVDAPGRSILVAESAAEAESILEAREVDLVLLDLILPDRDGRDVLVRMREAARTATIPVVVLTAISSGAARTECLAVGADDFLEKPVDPSHLRSIVARLLRIGRMRRDSVRDGLTGLPNRAGIGAEFADRVRDARAAGVPLAVATLSVDALAEVAMKLGRDAGDRFLLEVCAALNEALAPVARLARWETGRLVALFPDLDLEQARARLTEALRVLAASDALDEFRDTGIDTSLSCGVAVATPEQSLHDVITVAERSLFEAHAVPDATARPGRDAVVPQIRTILLVEDDRVTATLIDHRLTRDGYRVVDFLDGSEAFVWASDNDFDLAILDVKVPGMDGFELLGRLREVPRLADVPVIMLTGMGSEADVVRGLELGADDYMLKPFSPSELLARVRRLLHARASSGIGPGSVGEAGR